MTAARSAADPGLRRARLPPAVRRLPVPAHRRRRRAPPPGSRRSPRMCSPPRPGREARVGGQRRLQLRGPAGARAAGRQPGGLSGGVPPGDGRPGRAARRRRATAPLRTGRAASGTPDIHVLVMISAMCREALRSSRPAPAAHIEHIGGLTVVHDELGAALPGGGRALRLRRRLRPAIDRGQRPAGAARARGRSHEAAAGGRSAQASSSSAIPTRRVCCPTAPPPAELSTNGSYLVYRKLHQDVAAFRAQLADGRPALSRRRRAARGEDRRPLARRHAARPLARAPRPRDRRRRTAQQRLHYGGDAAGLAARVGAHVRRANPRNSLPFEGKLVNRHRLIRRGIPYG